MSQYGLHIIAMLIGVVVMPTAKVEPDVDCTDPQGTPEINYCAGIAYEQADAALNQVYQAVMKELDKEAKQLLRRAQQAWIAFRDAHCESAVFASRDGTGYGALLATCLQEVTEQRTQYLQERWEGLR